jgi:hypothetical protein
MFDNGFTIPLPEEHFVIPGQIRAIFRNQDFGHFYDLHSSVFLG